MMNSAIRTNEPVLLPDKHWELGDIAGNSNNMSIMEHEGLYTLWYMVLCYQKEELSRAEIKGFDDKVIY